MFLFYLFMALVFMFAGVINGLTPYYSRRGTPFGVTVPGKYQDHVFIKQMKKVFLIQNILLSSVFSLPLILFSGIEDVEKQEMWGSLYFLAAILLFLLITFGLYLHNRKAIQGWKREHQLTTDTQKERIVVDTNYHKNLNAVPTRVVILAQLGIVFATVVVTYLFYHAIPTVFPIHWNSQNVVDRVVEKSYLSVMMIPAIQLLMIPVMAFSHYSFIKSKQKLLANYPQLTSKQSQKFRHAWSIYFLIVSVALQLLLMLTNFYSLFFSDKIGMSWFSVIIGIFVFGVIGYTLFLTWKYGQGGEKLVFDQIKDASNDITEVDEEEYWKWGIFYYNPQDPSIFVEKRFGIGTTINLARWQAWAAIVGLILFIVLIAILPAVMA